MGMSKRMKTDARAGSRHHQKPPDPPIPRQDAKEDKLGTVTTAVCSSSDGAAVATTLHSKGVEADPEFSKWTVEDDILLKNAMEAGFAIEALAKGAMNFSQRFSIAELTKRWRALLYDPDVAVTAARRMVDPGGTTPALILKRKVGVESVVDGKSRRQDSVKMHYLRLKRKRMELENWNAKATRASMLNPEITCSPEVITGLEHAQMTMAGALGNTNGSVNRNGDDMGCVMIGDFLGGLGRTEDGLLGAGSLPLGDLMEMGGDDGAALSLLMSLPQNAKEAEMFGLLAPNGLETVAAVSLPAVMQSVEESGSLGLCPAAAGATGAFESGGFGLGTVMGFPDAALGQVSPGALLSDDSGSFFLGGGGSLLLSSGMQGDQISHATGGAGGGMMPVIGIPSIPGGYMKSEEEQAAEAEFIVAAMDTRVNDYGEGIVGNEEVVIGKDGAEALGGWCTSAVAMMNERDEMALGNKTTDIANKLATQVHRDQRATTKNIDREATGGVQVIGKEDVMAQIGEEAEKDTEQADERREVELFLNVDLPNGEEDIPDISEISSSMNRERPQTHQADILGAKMEAKRPCEKSEGSSLMPNEPKSSEVELKSAANGSSLRSKSHCSMDQAAGSGQHEARLGDISTSSEGSKVRVNLSVTQNECDTPSLALLTEESCMEQSRGTDSQTAIDDDKLVESNNSLEPIPPDEATGQSGPSTSDMNKARGAVYLENTGAGVVDVSVQPVEQDNLGSSGDVKSPHVVEAAVSDDDVVHSKLVQGQPSQPPASPESLLHSLDGNAAETTRHHDEGKTTVWPALKEVKVERISTEKDDGNGRVKEHEQNGGISRSPEQQDDAVKGSRVNCGPSGEAVTGSPRQVKKEPIAEEAIPPADGLSDAMINRLASGSSTNFSDLVMTGPDGCLDLLATELGGPVPDSVLLTSSVPELPSLSPILAPNSAGLGITTGNSLSFVSQVQTGSTFIAGGPLSSSVRTEAKPVLRKQLEGIVPEINSMINVNLVGIMGGIAGDPTVRGLGRTCSLQTTVMDDVDSGPIQSLGEVAMPGGPACGTISVVGGGGGGVKPLFASSCSSDMVRNMATRVVDSSISLRHLSTGSHAPLLPPLVGSILQGETHIAMPGANGGEGRQKDAAGLVNCPTLEYRTTERNSADCTNPKDARGSGASGSDANHQAITAAGETLTNGTGGCQGGGSADGGVKRDVGGKVVSNPKCAKGESDDEEGVDELDSDGEVPCFSDVEAMILDMDLTPAVGFEGMSARGESRRIFNRNKRTIVRLEQMAAEAVARAMTEEHAFAALYGKTIRYLMKKPEISLGRATLDYSVDVDLGREGKANKVSRQQAYIRLKQDGSFCLRNVGRRVLLVNNQPIEIGQRAKLENNCLIEVGGMRLIFEINRHLVRKTAAEPIRQDGKKQPQ